MKVKLIRRWDNCADSVSMTAYNLGMLRIASETEKIPYILNKINKLYTCAKKQSPVFPYKVSEEYITESKRLIDDVVFKLLRLGACVSDFDEWPTIYGPRADGYIPDIRTIKIERNHLIKALTPTRYL